MNINERKRSSASALPSQAICKQPFCPFINGFCSKICSSKRLLARFEDNAIYGKIVGIWRKKSHEPWSTNSKVRVWVGPTEINFLEDHISAMGCYCFLKFFTRASERPRRASKTRLLGTQRFALPKSMIYLVDAKTRSVSWGFAQTVNYRFVVLRLPCLFSPFEHLDPSSDLSLSIVSKPTGPHAGLWICFWYGFLFVICDDLVYCVNQRWKAYCSQLSYFWFQNRWLTTSNGVFTRSTTLHTSSKCIQNTRANVGRLLDRTTALRQAFNAVEADAFAYSKCQNSWPWVDTDF